ncbi:hypothetical protein BTHE68_36740 [Burkholderia sp. THE68]|uniref:glycoside hydrolase family 19 protein n=1 Tax=Burkholderia sp. THE68 TaxID=758782 RepID=UPI0013188A58|nr:hypothetical protein [Burkholderia sp. THE68]BBU29940.1 hypothetical protein BTHE68_36740 [Burkholderia sp. THE68]
MQAASRLIVKHESEWANPQKWRRLYTEIEQGATNPRYEEEQKRIEKLVWWDEVKAGVPGFPGPDVFHVHPVGLVGNFKSKTGLISMEMLLAVAPENSREYSQTILDPLNKYAELYSVDTPRRIAHFLSQMAHESSLRAVDEGLSYSSKQMRKTFGCKGGDKRYDPHCDDCTMGRLREKLWTQSDYYQFNPEHLANYVYADRMGNGDEESGDGYKYRGRGFIQTTGRDNYRSFMEEHNRRSPDDVKDFVQTPDLLSDLNYAVESVYVFWSKNSLNAVADNGTVVSVTQRVNGGQKGIVDRLSRFNRVAHILNVSAE